MDPAANREEMREPTRLVWIRRRSRWIRAGLTAAALFAAWWILDRPRGSRSVLDDGPVHDDTPLLSIDGEKSSPAEIVPEFRLAPGPLIARCPTCGIAYTGSVGREFLRYYTRIPDLEGGPR